MSVDKTPKSNLIIVEKRKRGDAVIKKLNASKYSEAQKKIARLKVVFQKKDEELEGTSWDEEIDGMELDEVED